ncbi:MAG: DUF2339 domain-containing protein [Leptospirales bacterium]
MNKDDNDGIGIKVAGFLIGLFWSFILGNTLTEYIAITLIGGLFGFVIALTNKLNKLQDYILSDNLQPTPESSKQKPVPVPVQAATKAETGKKVAKPVEPVEPKPIKKAAKPEPVVKTKSAALNKKSPGASAALPPKESREKSPIVEFLSGKNTAVLLGVFILFLGIVFLLKYTIENIEIPIEIRMAAVMLGGMSLIYIGWRLRLKKTVYALILQGGGVAILYATIFISFRYYELIPAPAAFSSLVLVMILSMILAILQDSLIFALIGTTGGFLAPILASTGSGNYVALFSYYAVFNTGILGVAFFRSWKPLNLLGFFFTFVIAAIWGVKNYQPEDFINAEIFLNLFFIMFSVISVLFAYKQPPNLKGIIDGALVFALPLTYMGMQFYLLKDIEYGSAGASLGLGLYYIFLVFILFKSSIKGLHDLMEAFLVMGIIFVNLAAPLALDAPSTSAFWALEGAGLIWAGKRQSRLAMRAFGFILILGSWLFFIPKLIMKTPETFFNGQFFGLMLLVIAGGYITNLYRSKWDYKEEEKTFSVIIYYVTLVWWLLVGWLQISYLLPEPYLTQDHSLILFNKPTTEFINIFILFFSLSCLTLLYLAKRLKWLFLEFMHYAIFPILVLLLLGQWPNHFANGGLFFWIGHLLILYTTLYLNKTKANQYLDVVHFGALLIIVSISSNEFYYKALEWLDGVNIWVGLSSMVPSLLVFVTLSSKKVLNSKLVKTYRLAYTVLPGLFFGSVLLLSVLVYNFVSNGSATPLPYMPLLNPLDMYSLVVFAAIFRWVSRVKPGGMNAVPNFKELSLLITAVVVLWLNLTVARVLHHWVGLEWSFYTMFHSTMAQMVYSIFWGLLGLGSMITGAKKAMRSVWVAGAIFMGVVVVKLFFVDLANAGTLFRIISFMVIGIFLLIIGYLAPVPPDKVDNSKNNENDTGNSDEK